MDAINCHMKATPMVKRIFNANNINILTHVMHMRYMCNERYTYAVTKVFNPCTIYGQGQEEKRADVNKWTNRLCFSGSSGKRSGISCRKTSVIAHSPGTGFSPSGRTACRRHISLAINLEKEQIFVPQCAKTYLLTHASNVHSNQSVHTHSLITLRKGLRALRPKYGSNLHYTYSCEWQLAYHIH